MLQELHVKNFALIDDVEIEFHEGLNILSGETGAGKSIIMGSVNMALGQKTSRDVIRNGCSFAYVELGFSLNEAQKRRLEQFDLSLDENEDNLFISRKLTETKSICRINGENVSASTLRDVAAVLIDIHGQSDNQTLLRPKKQLELLDLFGKEKLEPVLKEYSCIYEEFIDIQRQLNETDLDDDARIREMSYLEFVLNEIDEADISESEEEELAAAFKKLSNSKKLQDGINKIRQGLFEGERAGTYSASAAVSDAISEIGSLKNELPEDEELGQLADMMYDLESLFSDLSHGLDRYFEQIDECEEEYDRITKRLDVYHELKGKYGHSVSDIIAYRARTAEEYLKLKNYGEKKEENLTKLEEYRGKLYLLAEQIHKIRTEYARELGAGISGALTELNFANAEFEVAVNERQELGPDGTDSVCFMISPNRGEAIKPMAEIVSGGELSRIMLAVKTVLSQADEIEAFIFDEIDAGISGRTAQMVADKLNRIGQDHQIICVSHLPQIVAMADYHYRIEKMTQEDHTFTQVIQLEYEESVNEIARLLGGSQITQAVLDNAWEMKELAQKSKFN